MDKKKALSLVKRVQIVALYAHSVSEWHTSAQMGTDIL